MPKGKIYKTGRTEPLYVPVLFKEQFSYLLEVLDDDPNLIDLLVELAKSVERARQLGRDQVTAIQRTEQIKHENRSRAATLRNQARKQNKS